MWTCIVCSIFLLHTKYCFLFTYGFLSTVFDTDDQSYFPWLDSDQSYSLELLRSNSITMRMIKTLYHSTIEIIEIEILHRSRSSYM